MRVAMAMALAPALLSAAPAWAQSDDAGEVGVTAAAVADTQRVTLGFFAGGFLPSSEHELFDPTITTQVELSTVAFDFGVRAGYFPLRYAGLEVEGHLIPTGTEGRQSGLLYGARGHIRGHYPAVVTPFAVAGAGILGIASGTAVLGDDVDAIAYLGGGLEYPVFEEWLVRADVRLDFAPRGMARTGSTTHGEFLLGLSYNFGASVGRPKTVSRSAPDDIDFPDDELARRRSADDDDELDDPDRDGVAGSDDSCPDQAETVNGYRDTDGCPDTAPPADSDNDTIPDDKDACPTDGEDLDGHRDADGCPDDDDDGDGIPDADDRCRLVKGPAVNGGCPDPDRDGDGVVDRLDNCPDQKGSDRNLGCKRKQRVVIEAGKLKLLGKVNFRNGSAIIARTSFALLDNVAAVLRAHPELTQVTIEDHTDSAGDAAKKKDLSQRRAESVLLYLVHKKVDKSRLSAAGFGGERPIRRGNSRSARAENRRVEFRITTRAP